MVENLILRWILILAGCLWMTALRRLQMISANEVGCTHKSVIAMFAVQMECVRVNVIHKEGLSHCRLTVEGHIIVRLFGIGRLAERIIIESTHKTLRALPAIIDRCLQHFILSLSLGAGRHQVILPS